MDYTLMEQFSNPDLIHSLTFGEKMAGSLITMLMGMGVTFLVLILLWGMIAMMSKIMGTAAPKPAAAPATAATPVETVPLAASAGAISTAAPPSENADLVAVITAAVAAFEGDSGATSNLIVRKINRISGQAIPWNNAGRGDCIDSRKI